MKRERVWREQLSSTVRRLEREIDRRMQWQQSGIPDDAEINAQDVLDWITKTCLTTFDCQQVSLMLWEPDSQELVVQSATGHPDMARALGTRVRLGEGIAGWVAKTRESLILGPDLKPGKFKGFQIKVHPLAAFMIVPLILRDRPIGVLNVSTRSQDTRYSEEDLRSLQVFAGGVAEDCDLAVRIEWIRKTIRKLDTVLMAEEDEDLRKAA